MAFYYWDKYGTTDNINELLANACTGGYVGGIIGDANRRYVMREFPELVRLIRVYRLGDTLELVTPVKDSRALGELVGELQSAKRDYPIISDDDYNEIIEECESDYIRELCANYGLNESVAWEVIRDEDIYLEVDGEGYVYGIEDEEAFAWKIHTKSQTWDGHYNGGQYHHSGACPWCQESPEIAPVR